MKDNVWSFHYQYRNANPFMESFRDEKFTTRHKRHNPIPHSWLSSCGKIEIPHSRLRRSWGISISPRLLSHSWGIGISLLWLVVNFQFLHLRLRRSCRNYPVPETFHKWIGSFTFISYFILQILHVVPSTTIVISNAYDFNLYFEGVFVIWVGACPLFEENASHPKGRISMDTIATLNRVQRFPVFLKIRGRLKFAS